MVAGFRVLAVGVLFVGCWRLVLGKWCCLLLSCGWVLDVGRWLQVSGDWRWLLVITYSILVGICCLFATTNPLSLQPHVLPSYPLSQVTVSIAWMHGCERCLARTLILLAITLVLLLLMAGRLFPSASSPAPTLSLVYMADD